MCLSAVLSRFCGGALVTVMTGVWAVYHFESCYCCFFAADHAGFWLPWCGRLESRNRSERVLSCFWFVSYHTVVVHLASPRLASSFLASPRLASPFLSPLHSPLPSPLCALPSLFYLSALRWAVLPYLALASRRFVFIGLSSHGETIVFSGEKRREEERRALVRILLFGLGSIDWTRALKTCFTRF